ncbi:MAG: phosphotransferase [Eubacteriales bacterium]|nr:phosphotransferase [Eubacteriales bacterium]
MNISDLVLKEYGYTVRKEHKLSVGAGSNTYILDTDNGRFVLKNPSTSQINLPDAEPALCQHMLAKGLPVSRFVPTRSGKFVLRTEQGDIWHMQHFEEGVNYALNAAPEWLLDASAAMLGRIHTALLDYPTLPDGIGEGFFNYMTPARALASYEATLRTAEAQKLSDIAQDVRWRMGLMERFPLSTPDIDCFTRGNTHGDYFISQLLCGDGRINAVIDWTSACRHPLVWELMRSYVYADPACAKGNIDIPRLLACVRAYLQEAPLTHADIIGMPELFYYQIAVCDYYSQYLDSDASNRHIYLHQAVFSTRLMQWFEANLNTLRDALEQAFPG